MLGILSMIIGGIGFAFSATDQKYAETKACMDAEKAGRRFYTDSHGRQRDVKTNRILTTYEMLRSSNPQTKTETRKKLPHKVWIMPKDDMLHPIILEYFENRDDAYDYAEMVKKDKSIYDNYWINYI